jgi:hypothetical protein
VIVKGKEFCIKDDEDEEEEASRWIPTGKKRLIH